MNCRYEAVQFGEWGRWHAVRPDTDRTFCGRSALGARRMWEEWDEAYDRCQQCDRAVGQNPPTVVPAG